MTTRLYFLPICCYHSALLSHLLHFFGCKMQEEYTMKRKAFLHLFNTIFSPNQHNLQIY